MHTKQKKINIISQLKNSISWLSFRRLLIYTLTTTCTFYFGSLNYASFLNFNNFQEIFENYVLLKFIGISLLVHVLFYWVLEYFLRLLFHGYIRDKIHKIHKDLAAQGRFSYLKDMHFFYSLIKGIFKNYVYRLGFFSKRELMLNIGVSELDKEELFNWILTDIYKSICAVVHFLFTLFFIWKFLNFWIILVSILLLLVLFVFTAGIVFMLTSIDLWDKVRRDIIKSK